MKRWTALLMAGLLLLTLAPFRAMAEETEPETSTQVMEETEPETQPEIQEPPAKDQCGEALTWRFENGTLTISGTGNMYDFPEGAPWAEHKNEIRVLKLTGGVTSVGAGAFQDYDNLETLDLGGSLKEVGVKAFSSCDGLTSVSLPATFRIFGEESFSHCRNLKEFTFAGGMPSFKLNCLWDTAAKLIYPANHPWPLQHIEQLETAFQGRIEFLASDGTDPYTPQEAQPETQPSTRPATEPTQAPTEAPAVPETTVPATTALPTQPETESVVTEPQRPEVPDLPDNEFVELPDEEESSGSFMLPLMIGIMVVSLLGIIVVAVVLVRSREKRIEADLEEDLRGPQIPRHPAPERKPVPEARGQKASAAPRTPEPHRPTQAEKTARKETHKKGGKFSR